MRFNVLDWKLGGTIMGDRTIELSGSLVVEDLANALKAVVVVGTYKSSGIFKKSTTGSKSDLLGVIYKAKTKGLEPTKFGKSQKLPDDISSIKDIDSKLCEV